MGRGAFVPGGLAQAGCGNGCGFDRRASRHLEFVAVHACVARVGTGGVSTVNLVQQLTRALHLGELGAAPRGAMVAVGLVGKAHWVVPVGRVALVEGVGLADGDVDVGR